MVSLRALVVLTAASFAFAGVAQATPLKSDSRQAPTATEASDIQVAEAIHIRTPVRAQTADARAPKPRIWISMGFGF